MNRAKHRQWVRKAWRTGQFAHEKYGGAMSRRERRHMWHNNYSCDYRERNWDTLVAKWLHETGGEDNVIYLP